MRPTLVRPACCDKVGQDEGRCYKALTKQADALYDRHLVHVAKERNRRVSAKERSHEAARQLHQEAPCCRVYRHRGWRPLEDRCFSPPASPRGRRPYPGAGCVRRQWSTDRCRQTRRHPGGSGRHPRPSRLYRRGLARHHGARRSHAWHRARRPSRPSYLRDPHRHQLVRRQQWTVGPMNTALNLQEKIMSLRFSFVFFAW